MRRDPFQAIADPTRRAILKLLAKKKSLNLNAVTDHFEISRPAVSKHIKILTECGLIEIRQEGRERFCEAKPAGLDEVRAWVDEYRSFWEAKLDALENYLIKIQTKKKPHGSKKQSRK